MGCVKMGVSSTAALSVTCVLAMSYSGRHIVSSKLIRQIIRGHQLGLMDRSSR